jgi:hypothetical protein
VSHHRARVVTGASLAALLLLGAGEARAQVTATTSYTTAGRYAFTVPAGVTSVVATVVGAAGGSGWCVGSGGGQGASITASLRVSPGEQLLAGVGAPGGSDNCTSAAGAGGFGGGNGGGGGANNGNVGGGGGGGGASMLGSALPSPAFGGLLLVAGGGGGGGGGISGGAGGGAGQPGGTSLIGAAGGGAGTATAGGAGGGAGVAGSLGLGGHGAANPNSGGGGGGGGYYGGGGGDGNLNGGGGGGGSSFFAPGATGITGPALTANPPVVTLTYAAPTAVPSATTLSFATQPQATVSAPQTLTLTNNGSAPLVVSGATLTGSNADDYVIHNGCQAPVAAGQNCALTVRFAPSAAGASSATLTLATNAATAPAGVALSGTGGALPQGPAGPQGPIGPQGPAGPTGTPLPSPKPAATLVGATRRVVTVKTRKGERFLSATATLNGKRLTVRGRSITVDLRGKNAGSYTVRIAAKYRTRSGTVHVVRSTRTLKVTTG